MQDYGAWAAVRAAGAAAGDLGPYSVNLLEDAGFDVRHTDRMFRGPWSNRPVVRALGKVERTNPALSGLRNAAANRGVIRRSDITLGIFEDHGGFAAAVQTTPLRRLFPTTTALLVCWMAERARSADRRALDGYRRILDGARLTFYFSGNQTEIYTDLLRADPDRLRPVDFGIDAEFFAPPPVSRDDGYVLAVGGDASRDHELLVEAVRGTGVATRIHAPRLAVEDLPGEVTWIPRVIPHVEYRDALAGARLVVVPTRAVAYPGGQTVLLEAMASGKAVIATDTAAIRHYVVDGTSGALVPPGDAGALCGRIADLLADREQRDRLAAAGLDAVRARFTQRRMWAAIGADLHSLL